LGAARLGQAAANNLDGGTLSSVMSKPRIATSILPKEDLVDAYTRPLARWRDLYHAIKPSQNAAADI